MIHDVKGLEKGDNSFEEYVLNTKNYLKKNYNAIHLVWYVIGNY
jgi:hypothetical protein